LTARPDPAARSSENAVTAAAPRRRLWAECFRASLFLGLTSFGGPAAHAAYFERLYVQKLGWLNAAAFAQIMALCHLLPGPASSQMNFLIGWIRGGAVGAVLSFTAFTLPSALLMLAAAVYAQAIGGVDVLVHGLKLLAAVVVAQAVLSMGQRLCPDWRRRIAAAVVALICALFGGIYIQIGIILLGALFGLWFLPRQGLDDAAPLPNVIGQNTALRAVSIFVLLLVALPVFTGMGGVQGAAPLAEVFYRSGALVFGGGHVVLPLLYDALPAAREQMMLFYGLAQVLPGPLFTVAAALGYALFPVAPVAGAAVALGFIFLPGLLLAVGGYYFWQRITQSPRLLGVIAGVNAAVVGILAGALIDPVLTGALQGWMDAAFVLICITITVWKKLPVAAVMVICAVYALASGFAA
jgi:chromate transporter